MEGYRTLGLVLAGCVSIWGQSFNLLPAATYPAGNGSLVTAKGDFNGDGKLDIAVGNAASNNVSVFLGNGDGSFTAGASVTVPGCLVGFLSAGDFNRDGHTDLLAVCQFQNAVWVLPGLGNGKFGKPISTILPSITLIGQGLGFFPNYAVADFNNDGIPDLVIGLADPSFDASSISISLLLGNGDGTFQLPIVIVEDSSFVPTGVIAADFNRDGNQDLLVSFTSLPTATSHAEILLGTGKGTFQPPQSLNLPAEIELAASMVADVNKDGIPDIVFSWGSASDKGTGGIFVYLGAGDGTFRQSFSGPYLGAIGLLPADLRGTGTVDLVEAVEFGTGMLSLQISAGNGDGTFQNPVSVAFPSGLEPWWQGLVAGDWNGDGLTDLAFAALPAGFRLSGITGNSIQLFITALEGLPAGNLVVILNGLTPMPALAVSENQIQFVYVAGGAAPSVQSVAISNSGTGTLNWTASADSPWLKLSPSSGTGSGILSISISPTGLTPANYTGHVQISATGASGSPQTVTVTLTISAPSNAPVITGVVNGASFQAGIESGSWVTILGSNLSNTNPGRTWTAGEIVNGNLPQSLDGTSVNIDGKPAYVYYISPTQINVQAPTDSAAGSVPVVVTNNSQVSAPFNAQLQAAAPAFFLYSGTNYAIASHYPDYALVGTSNAPAHPGDVLILWATGFGPTNPVTPAGVVVTGAPAVATLTAITIGGAQVPVTAAVLTPGSAGLYQIAIQLPSTVPTGSVAIQASVGGAMSPSGTSIFVSAQ